MSTPQHPHDNDAGTNLMAVALAARITAAVVANGGTVAEATRCGREILHHAHAPTPTWMQATAQLQSIGPTPPVNPECAWNVWTPTGSTSGC